MDKAWFAETLLQWYHQHKRDLPWRATADPYRIWLSEVILQQTRVQQGLPYYQRFVATFPTVADLAAADESEILRLWQGLGYYSRARNMHYAAQQVMHEMDGQFPTRYAALIRLKGVGSYTAAAIASFSSGEPVAVLDGNVFRVLARLFAVEEDILSTQGKKTFQALADELIPTQNAGDYNQAMMEFGATHCKPANPDCMFCPFAQVCQGRAKGWVARLPIKVKKVKVKKRYLHYLVIHQGDALIMKLREGKGIWQGLYDFPMIEGEKEHYAPEALRSKISETFGWNQPSVAEEWVEKVHLLTHQRLLVRFYEVYLQTGQSLNLRPETTRLDAYPSAKVKALPKPQLIVNYLAEKFAIYT